MLLIFPSLKIIFPLAIVATGHPFRFHPSKELHLHLVNNSLFLTSFSMFKSIIAKSASKPSLIKPLFFILKILAGFSQHKLIIFLKVIFFSLNAFNNNGSIERKENHLKKNN